MCMKDNKNTIAVKKLTDKDILEVGDFIVQENVLTGNSTFKIHRVTAKLAKIRWNENTEGTFSRDRIQKNGTISLRGKVLSRDQTTYTVYRKKA